MNIFEFAKQKEKSYEQFYRDLARRSTNTGLSRIFTMLADEEAEHYRVVEQMGKGRPAQVAETSVLDRAGRIFIQIKDSAEDFNLDINPLELYRKAGELENESRTFYLDRAKEVRNEVQKRFFRELAEQEQDHYVVLDNICSFVARPQTYMEDVEFYHIYDSVEWFI